MAPAQPHPLLSSRAVRSARIRTMRSTAYQSSFGRSSRQRSRDSGLRTSADSDELGERLSSIPDGQFLRDTQSQLLRFLRAGSVASHSETYGELRPALRFRDRLE